jgi:sugar lactone lactonase YvrE
MNHQRPVSLSPLTPLPHSTSQLGESPFWHPHEQKLYWVDIPGMAIFTWSETSGTTRWAMPEEPGCMAPAQSGDLVVAFRSGVYKVQLLAHGQHSRQLLAAAPYDPTHMRFNDGKCDAQGRFWAGSLTEIKTEKTGALYCLEKEGAQSWQLRLMAQDCTTANGLAFSADQKTVYWVDTPTHQIDQFDWLDASSAHHSLSHRRAFKTFPPKTAGQSYGGRPDGACMDSEGCYWIAMYEGAQVMRLSPAGEVLQQISLPVTCTTMPTLGGHDLRTLFITTACKGRPAEELAQQPWAGSVLHVQVDVPGIPVNFFAG